MLVLHQLNWYLTFKKTLQISYHNYMIVRTCTCIQNRVFFWIKIIYWLLKIIIKSTSRKTVNHGLKSSRKVQNYCFMKKKIGSFNYFPFVTTYWRRNNSWWSSYSSFRWQIHKFAERYFFLQPSCKPLTCIILATQV